MSFNITMDFLGLDEVQREIERLATASELKDLNKKIVKKAGKVGLEESEGQIRKKAYSKNPMKSGRRGSRTGQPEFSHLPFSSSPFTFDKKIILFSPFLCKQMNGVL